MEPTHYDALLVVSFGGPESQADVIPFLKNVLRGRNVPPERLAEVAGHYYKFGGRSPINDQNRVLIAALRDELRHHNIDLPIYWGNRNWHPLIADAVREMTAARVTRALALVTSAFSSYSGCRQYREDIARACDEIGFNAPQIDKLRGFFNHPGFIETMTDRVWRAFEQIAPHRRADAALIFTAHSIPLMMAASSDYVKQLEESARLIAQRLERPRWRIAYQSRSGPPSQPWLEPDICAVLREISASGATDAVVVPLGFVSDHMEVVYDLDTEARAVADSLGLRMVRAGTAGAHPRFVAMLRELIEERLNGRPPQSIGLLGPQPDFCLRDCCPAHFLSRS